MEYTKLEYIESTGTQYIDTGVKFGTGFACDIKFNMLSTSGDVDLLSSGVDENYLLVSCLNGTPRIYLNGSASRDITTVQSTACRLSTFFPLKRILPAYFLLRSTTPGLLKY